MKISRIVLFLPVSDINKKQKQNKKKKKESYTCYYRNISNKKKLN